MQIPFAQIDYAWSPKAQTFTMTSISTPEPKQSEAYIATMALFILSSSSTREDKVFLRLPATWRDLWSELAELKKEQEDEVDRNAIRTFRDMVRRKRDREMEDGILIQGAFRNRASVRASDHSDDSGPEKGSKASVSSDTYRKIWEEKSRSSNYQEMLVSCTQVRAYYAGVTILEITYAASNVGIQG